MLADLVLSYSELCLRSSLYVCTRFSFGDETKIKKVETEEWRKCASRSGLFVVKENSAGGVVTLKEM